MTTTTTSSSVYTHRLRTNGTASFVVALFFLVVFLIVIFTTLFLVCNLLAHNLCVVIRLHSKRPQKVTPDTHRHASTCTNSSINNNAPCPKTIQS
jgi:hypothetical protein